MDIIENNSDLPWVWKYISNKKYPDKIWDWEELSNIQFKQLINKLNLPDDIKSNIKKKI